MSELSAIPSNCIACEGNGTLLARIQQRVSGRVIVSALMARCPACHGTGTAAQEALQRFLENNADD